MTHSNTTNKYKDRLIRLFSISEIQDCLETFDQIGNYEIVEKLFCLLRNLVDDNNLLIESKGEEIMNIISKYLKKQDIPITVMSRVQLFLNKHVIRKQNNFQKLLSVIFLKYSLSCNVREGAIDQKSP